MAAKIEQNKNSSQENVANEKKDRKFALVLYPNATNYDCESVLDAVRSRCPEWSYILHDKDCDDDGILIGEHYHVLIRYENPRSCASVLSVLGLPADTFIVCPKSYKGYLKYLVHATEDARTKYQYDVSSVSSNIPNIEGVIYGTTETTYLKRIVSYIDENPLQSFPSLARWALYQGDAQLWSVFRRNSSIIQSLLIEANNIEKANLESLCRFDGSSIKIDFHRSLKGKAVNMEVVREILNDIKENE